MKQCLDKPVIFADSHSATTVEFPISTPTIHPSPLTGEWADFGWANSREASEILMKAESAILLASEAGDADYEAYHTAEDDVLEDDMAHSDEHKSAHDSDEVMMHSASPSFGAPLSVDSTVPEMDAAFTVSPYSTATYPNLTYEPCSSTGAYSSSIPAMASYNSYYYDASGYGSYDASMGYSTELPQQPCSSSYDMEASYCQSSSTGGYCACYRCAATAGGAYSSVPDPSMGYPMPSVQQARFVSSYPRTDSYNSMGYDNYDSHSTTYSASEYVPDSGTPSFVHQYREIDDKNANKRRKSTRFPVPPPPTKTRSVVTEEKFYHSIMRWYSHIHDWDISKPPCPPPLSEGNESEISYSYEDWLILVDDWYHNNFSNTRRPVRSMRH